MSKKYNDHYIQAAYLGGFTELNQTKPRNSTFTHLYFDEYNKEVKVLKKTPNSVCKEKGWDSSVDFFIYKKLGLPASWYNRKNTYFSFFDKKLEEDFNKYSDCNLNSDSQRFNDENIKFWSEYISNLCYRHKKAQEDAHTSYYSSQCFLSEKDKYIIARDVAQPLFRKLLQEGNWIEYKIQDNNLDFICSDNPVTLVAEKELSRYPNIGFLKSIYKPQWSVYFPKNNKTTFVITNSNQEKLKIQNRILTSDDKLVISEINNYTTHGASNLFFRKDNFVFKTLDGKIGDIDDFSNQVRGNFWLYPQFKY